MNIWLGAAVVLLVTGVVYVVLPPRRAFNSAHALGAVVLIATVLILVRLS